MREKNSLESYMSKQPYKQNNSVIRLNHQKKQFFQVVGSQCELLLLPEHRQKFLMAASFKSVLLFSATAGGLVPRGTARLYQ